MGFVPQPQSEYCTEVTFVEGTNVTLVHLDAYLTTVVTYFSGDGTDTAGDRW